MYENKLFDYPLAFGLPAVVLSARLMAHDSWLAERTYPGMLDFYVALLVSFRFLRSVLRLCLVFSLLCFSVHVSLQIMKTLAGS